MHSKKQGMAIWLLIGTFLAGLAAHGSIAPIGPFTGSLQESWESFPNAFDDPDTFMDDPTTIMGGAASISNPLMVIYEPGVATFSLLDSGNAGIVDGDKGMGLNAATQAATVEFAAPVTSFGGYWGAVTGSPFPNPATVSFDFFDGANNLIDSKSFTYSRTGIGDGLLEWHGWSSTVPIKSLTYTGDYVVNDYLQANPIPEASTYALFGLGTLGLMVWRRRKR